jgi:hypothetical protein
VRVGVGVAGMEDPVLEQEAGVADPGDVGDEAERLTGLGARPLNDVKLPGVRWTTFADPEGNEFDLVTW